MLKDLKEFLLRGNVVDLAVAVIIGAAFGAIVTSLVNDIITPAIGLLGGTPDFSDIKIAGAIKIGNFINAVVNFLIVGSVLFFVVKAAEKAQNLTKKEEETVEEPAAPTELEVLQEIKALLEKQK
ncbi:MAG: large conductance mechanosensitive channel protein MscL [Streptococcus sp.]|nr:large conductance mechanosensitive channel protein MscL [Streptococcus sp.]